MAQYTRLPAGAPPTPPERDTTGHVLLRAFAVFLLFAVFTPTAWQHALGTWGSVGMASATTAAAVAIGVPRLVRRRHQDPFPWRRLPWAALAYVAFAGLSILWSAWPMTTAVTWVLLVFTTLQALFLAEALTWRELLRALASALKWVLGLSLAFELWVSLVVKHPILPNFITAPAGPLDPQWYWSRNNLLDGGRIQGIVGNANLLAALCLLAIIVLALRIWSGAERQGWQVGWAALALFLLARAGSATVFVCAIVCATVLVTALLMRRAPSPEVRARISLVYIALAVVGVVTAWLLRFPALEALGRGSDLTFRETIWTTVLAKAAQRPVAGWGYASPWLPWDPAFETWIIDHDMPVMQAHNMWLDVFFQLGWIGVIIIAGLFFTLAWRAWFFAVDRPRWDLRADRPYSPVSLLPTLVVSMLLVQGFTESAPIMLWGWMLVVLFQFKIKAVPLVGVGLSERSPVLERGERARRVP